MAGEYSSIVTDLGTKKIFDAMNGGDIVKVVTFAVGDGGGNAFVPSSDMTKLKNEVWRGYVNSFGINEEYENTLTVTSVIPADIGGFTIREMGIFDESGTLIAICNTPDTQKVKISEGVVHELELSMEIVLLNAECVDVIADPNIVVATKKDVEKLRITLENQFKEQKGSPNGIAELDEKGIVPENQLPNVSDQMPEFEEAGERENIESGEKLSTIFGKIKKFFADLKKVAFTGSYNDLSDTPFNATTSAAGLMSAADKGKLDGIAAGANKYTHPASAAGAKSSGLYKITTDANGHITGVAAVTKEDITALGIPGADTNTTYSNFVKSGSGAKAGLVPAPSTTAGTTKYLREDGTWTVPPDNNTTYSNFVKSGSGAKAGLVPAPSTTAGTTKYLREDGTWTVPPDNNTTYSNFVKSGSGAKAGLVPAPSTTAGTTKYLREDGTWTVPPNTTYGTVTTSAAGLMSPDDKANLDMILANTLIKKGTGNVIEDEPVRDSSMIFASTTAGPSYGVVAILAGWVVILSGGTGFTITLSSGKVTVKCAYPSVVRLIY